MKKGSLFLFLIPVWAVVSVYGQTMKSEEMKKSITLPQENVTLKPGKGLDQVKAYCAICHSLDYISMQPGGTKAQWTGTVTKMIKVFGAPVPEDAANIIIAYLSTHYGEKE